MKKIYIAYDGARQPMCVIMATSQREAEIFIGGLCENFDRVEEIDPSDETMGIHGIVTILTSIEVRLMDVSHKKSDWSFRMWKRGR